MTLHIADIASYQGALTAEQLREAGFGAVNVKVSHGLTQKSVHPDAATWLHCGLAVSTFHWLDASTSGAAQAVYAYDRLLALGGPHRWAHVVDCEADADERTWREYVTTMAALLGRPVATYTGDWYWQPRGWTGADASPWLWAAPNDGYLSAYPGDTSPQWRAGYGGWPELAVMQYRVGAIGGVNVSQSAVRSADVWTAMTGGDMADWILVPCLVALRAEFNKLAPDRDHASDGSIGDLAHQDETSDHNPDETGRTAYEDADSINEVHAIDVDKDLNRPDVTMEDCVQVIVRRHRAGTDNRLQYVIYQRRIWSRSWGWTEREYTGTNPHDKHAHFSSRYTTAQESDTSPWGLIEEFGDMALDLNDAKTIVNADIIKAPDGSKNPDGSVNEKWSMGSYLYWGYKAQVQGRDFASAALAAVKTLAAQDNVDEAAIGAAVAPIVAQGVTQAVLSALPQDVEGMTSDELGQAIQAGVQSGMRAVFADAAA